METNKSAKVVVKRVTAPNSKEQLWLIIDHEGEIPEGLTVSVNGGYAGIFWATADYPVGRKMKSAKAQVLRTWTAYVSDTGYEQTRFAEVEVVF